MLRTVVECREK